MAFLLLSLALLLPLCAAEPEQAVTFGRSYQHASLPTFDRGYLLFIVDPGNIEVWGPDGRQRFITTVENPAGARALSLAVDSDGTVAASVAVRGADGRSGGIAYFDPSGKQTRFVDTGRYMPAHLCFDGSHSLWSFGWQQSPSSDYEDPGDYMMFHKYSSDGVEAGRYGPRSLLPRGLPPGSPSQGLWRIAAAGDRIGALAYSGQTSERKVWLELGLDGHLFGQWQLGSDSNAGLAFTSDARLCRQWMEGPPKLECFDRSVAVWKSAGSSPVPGLLLGAQKDQLVFGRDDGLIHLAWSRLR